MKKWLNIKAKLNDFSEDEFDTDGGDEDFSDCAEDGSDNFFEIHENNYTINRSSVKYFGLEILNYRIDMPDAEIRDLVAMKRWDDLLKSDQLTKELTSGNTFAGWKEGLINFPPTYKYETNSRRYVGEKPNEVGNKKSPAWCDRIPWLGKGIKQLSYWSSGLNLLDYQPVSSTSSLKSRCSIRENSNGF